MPTVAPTGNGDQVAAPVNNGGTLIKGGGLTSESPMTKSFTESDLADDFGQSFGSKVIAKDGTGSQYTDRVGISGVKSAGIIGGETELGYNADGTEWVVVGGNVTTTLAGESYTGLTGGQAGPDPTRDHINELETTRALGKVDIDILARPSSGINSFASKGVSDGGYNPGDEIEFIRPSGAGDETSDDKAGSPTAAVPGELTYMFGGTLPATDNYKARDTKES